MVRRRNHLPQIDLRYLVELVFEESKTETREEKVRMFLVQPLLISWKYLINQASLIT